MSIKLMKPGHHRKMFLTAVICLSLLVLVFSNPGANVRAWNNGLALTPPMGWNTWYCFYCNYNETMFKSCVDAIVSSGMKDAGYIYASFDDCWLASSRDGNGKLYADPTKFPSGIQGIADYVHSKGLKLGIYEDCGTATCAGYPGSINHYQTDADTFAAWGVDLLKLDWCNTSGLNQQTQYTQMRDCLANTGRPINFNICEWGSSQPWTWAGPVGNSWRTTGDSSDSWSSIVSIIDQNANLSAYAGPGHWNDPDYLMAGLGGMTSTEYQSQFSLWCIMAAPLFSSGDIRAMTQATRDVLLNTEVIAVDQDTAGIQGTRVRDDGEQEVWCKPLGAAVGTTKAVALFNRASSAANITVNWSEIGIAAGSATVRNLWTKIDLGSFNDSYTANVPAHGTILVKIVGTASAPTPTPMPNLAIGKTASASSIWDVNYSADKANDANMSTRWNTAAGKTANEWLQIDFGANTSFNKIITKENPAFQRISGYKLQYYNGTSWVDLVTGTTVGTSKVDNFATVTASKVRLYITAASDCPTIDEFEVYFTGNNTPTPTPTPTPTSTPSPTPGVNLAKNKTASASTIWGTGYEASKANDGNGTTRWNAAATDGVGAWLQVDFGANTTFKKTIITQDFNRITGYKIQYWNGSSWVDAYTGGTMGTSPKVDTFTAVTGSKVRLYVTAIQVDGGPNPCPTIWEFEVYNN
jgi:hypothetical protein